MEYRGVNEVGRVKKTYPHFPPSQIGGEIGSTISDSTSERKKELHGGFEGGGPRKKGRQGEREN